MATAALRNRLVVGGLAGLVAAAGGYTVVYPYVRDVHLVNQQQNEADALTVKKIEDAYKLLQDHPECNSLLKKHLTREVVNQLKYKKTKLGASLYDVIRSGVYNLDAHVGVYAPDAESYKTFATLFDPIIQEYHNFGVNDKQPPVDLGEGRIGDFPPLDPDGKYIKSTRIRCGRSLAGYPFNPLLTGDDYLIMQQKVRNALDKVKDADLKGVYYPLQGMTKETQKQLITDHFLFREGDRHLQQANACNFWPKGRGIFHNDNKSFLVWVNEEDHLRLISMQEGSDVGAVLDRLIRGIKTIEKVVPFSRDARLGYLTFCPTNLGSTVRASVHIKLPKLSARKDFKQICDELNLQIRGADGESSKASEGTVMDISNRQRLGISEYGAVRQMYDGIKKLIEMEESAAKS